MTAPRRKTAAAPRRRPVELAKSPVPRPRTAAKRAAVVEAPVEPEPPMLPEYACPTCRTAYYDARTECVIGGTGQPGDELHDHERATVIHVGIAS